MKIIICFNKLFYDDVDWLPGQKLARISKIDKCPDFQVEEKKLKTFFAGIKYFCEGNKIFFEVYEKIVKDNRFISINFVFSENRQLKIVQEEIKELCEYF